MKTEELAHQVKQLQTDIDAIKARNKRVEADKAWETSKTRTTFVALVTFFLLFFFLKLIGADYPLLNAFIAVVGYWISTESYGVLKRWWLKRRGM